MSIFDAIFQGIIQGLTEFLPVSSSGHLSIAQHFTGKSGEGALMFSAILHLGTLVAVFIAFRKIIGELLVELGHMFAELFHGKLTFKDMNPQRRMICMVFISTACLIPFYIFKDWFESFSQDSSILAEGICLLYTSVILFLSDKCTKGTKTNGDIKLGDAVTVGLFQGVALLPGVSRSGSTISSALFCGFTRETAVSYSFVLGIPAILGGCFVEIKEAVDTNAMQFDFMPFVIGFIVAAVVGILAIKMVSWLVNKDKFKVFGIYTAVLGVLVIGVAVYEAVSGNIVTLK